MRSFPPQFLTCVLLLGHVWRLYTAMAQSLGMFDLIWYTDMPLSLTEWMDGTNACI